MPTTADTAIPVANGVFIAVVGPSGAGKDTLINHAKARFAGETDVLFVRRVITRASDGAGEDHASLTIEEFDRRERRGAFALSWSAHGLRYGVPAGADGMMRDGKVLVANLSRGAVPALRERYRNVTVVHVTARPETLLARLAARRRESEAQIRERISRSAAIDPLMDAITLQNDGRPEEAGERLVAIIREAVLRIRKTT